MKVVIINGQNHRGSTNHIARMLAEKTGGEITEFFLPRDFDRQCAGCAQCILESESKCPHREALHGITEALDAADLIILASPVYVYHCTGQMKSLLDHYAYRWMVHRAVKEMFGKQAVVVATAAGAGIRSTQKDMADSLFFWGVPKIYRLGYAVQATSWERVSEAHKKKIERDTDVLARRILARNGRTRPSLKSRLTFEMMRLMTLKMPGNPADVEYLRKMGWDGAGRPWKK